MYESERNNVNIPMLNLGGPPAKPKAAAPTEPPKLQLMQVPKQEQKPKKQQKPNLEKIKHKDFQDEFMENYEDFSESWREQIQREKRF